MRLAVIPARGGSKRIPRKNVRRFCGRPMIEWSIRAAIESACFERIVVSTDDEEIASVAEKAGALVPFRRPRELADDHAPTVPVIAHAVATEMRDGHAPSMVCCIYATAPFIRAEDLRCGLTLLAEATDAAYAFSVTSYPYPIDRALRLTPGGRVEMLHPERQTTRSQDLEERYHDAGQFYWGRPDAWLAGTPILAAGSLPVVLPRHRVQDIDTPEDWIRAEAMFKALNSESPDEIHDNRHDL